MLNYSTHAREAISGYLRKGAYNVVPGTQVALYNVLDLLHGSVKFELPEKGAIIDQDKCMEAILPGEMHLPYPVVALEFPYSDVSSLPAGSIAATKRIALRWHGHTHCGRRRLDCL